MMEEPVPSTSNRRRLSLRVCVAAAALLAYSLACVVFWTRDDWFPIWDSALYLLTGKSLAAGEGYLYQGQPFFLRPPGFPWLLSHLVQDGSYDFAALSRLMMGLGAASVTCVYLAMRPPLGSWKALAVALLMGTCPLFAESFAKALSEYPFQACLFGALALLHRSGDRGARWWLWSLAGALALAGAATVRTVAVIVLPAVLGLGWRRDRGLQRWRAVFPLIVVLLALLPWQLHVQQAMAEVEQPSDQLWVLDYTTCLFHVDFADPSSPLVTMSKWAQRLAKNGSAMMQDLAGLNLFLGPVWLQGLCVLALLAGFFLRCRRQPSLFEWLAVAYLAIVLAFPVYGRRLLLPIVPLLYLYLFEFVSAVARRVSRSAKAPGVACGLVFALLAGGNLASLPWYLTRDYASEVTQVRADKTLDLHSVAAWIRENTPDDAILLCSRAPVLALLADRRTYTYRFWRKRDLLTKYAVDYVVFDDRSPRRIRVWADARKKESWTVPVASGGKPVRIVRVSP